MRKSTAALSVALCISLVANIYLYQHLALKTAEVPYYTQHQPLIDKAVELFRSELPDRSYQQLQREMRPRFPMVSQIPDPRQAGRFLFCVTLKLRDGNLGFNPVYCFDERGNLVSRARI